MKKRYLRKNLEYYAYAHKYRRQQYMPYSCTIRNNIIHKSSGTTSVPSNEVSSFGKVIYKTTMSVEFVVEPKK